jgi:hypothetical protein
MGMKVKRIRRKSTEKDRQKGVERLEGPEEAGKMQWT